MGKLKTYHKHKPSIPGMPGKKESVIINEETGQRGTATGYEGVESFDQLDKKANERMKHDKKKK